MGSNKNTTRIFGDVKIDVKLKLAALWAVIMFLFIYADYKKLLEPGLLEQIIAGEVDSTSLTQGVLFFGAIYITIPSLMIFLSLALKPKVNRWVNIILAIVYFVSVIANLLTLETIWAYWIFYTVAETVIFFLIVLFACRWPKQET